MATCDHTWQHKVEYGLIWSLFWQHLSFGNIWYRFISFFQLPWLRLVTLWQTLVTLWLHLVTLLQHLVTFWQHLVTLWQHWATLTPTSISPLVFLLAAADSGGGGMMNADKSEIWKRTFFFKFWLSVNPKVNKTDYFPGHWAPIPLSYTMSSDDFIC